MDDQLPLPVRGRRTRPRDRRGVGPGHEISYRYHEAHFEASTRQFQGFRTTERITRGDASRPDSCEVHAFAMAQERVPGNGPGHALLNGVLERIETYASDGSKSEDRPLRVETCRHGLTVLETLPDGRDRVFVHVTENRRDDTERTDDVRTEITTYAYGEHGNVVREERRGMGTVGGTAVPEVTTVREIEYAVSAARHLVDKPSRVVVRDGEGTLVDEHRTYYDGPDFVGLPLGQVDRGLISREEELVLDKATFDAHYAGMDADALGYHTAADADGTMAVFAHPRRSQYDARGLAVKTLDPLGIETTLTYDDAGLFRVGPRRCVRPQRLRLRPGHRPDRRDHVGRWLHELTRFRYDAQGRVLTSALPGQDLDDPAGRRTRRRDRRAAPTHHRLRLHDGSHVVNVTYFDGTGNEFQQARHRFAWEVRRLGTFVGTRWAIRSRNRSQASPTHSTSRSRRRGHQTRRFEEYDGLGRVVRTVNFNGGVSTASFEPFAVTTRDANSNDSSPANVVRGRADVIHREQFDALRRSDPGGRQRADGRAGSRRVPAIGSSGELLEIRGTVAERGSRTPATGEVAGFPSALRRPVAGPCGTTLQEARANDGRERP